jgi:hypothetical protein
MAKSVCCLVASEAQAGELVNLLKLGGFSNDDISALLPDRGGPKDFGHEPRSKAPEGAVVGGLIGAAIVAALGWLAGARIIAVPDLTPLIAAGPILSALSGAAIGAALGGLMGAFVGGGISEFVACRFEGKIPEGNILISVHCENGRAARQAWEIFTRAGASKIGVSSETRVKKRSRRFAEPRHAI